MGCGYSGVELAATISERLQDRGKVIGINFDTNICPTAPSGNREAALKVMYQLIHHEFSLVNTCFWGISYIPFPEIYVIYFCLEMV